MESLKYESRLHPAWWALILISVIALAIAATLATFLGTFTPHLAVTLVSDRAGLVMAPGAPVKLRGVQVGEVAQVRSDNSAASLRLNLDPVQAQNIPSNVVADIRATTAFGGKYVNLNYPADPSPTPIASGGVIRSQNVSTEINTVFENLNAVLSKVDPAKINAVLTAVADGIRGQGPDIGQATTDANQVLTALNAHVEAIGNDWRATTGFSDTYAAAADNIVTILDAASTTSATVSANAKALDELLIGVVGLSRSGTELLAQTKDNLTGALDVLEPTTALLLKYSPEFTCTLQGAKLVMDKGIARMIGGNGKSAILDAALLLGQDPYVYPDNLPIVGAKGGPGGKPGCGSLPDVSKNFPVRQLITDTGWGTGLDVRPNPGVGFPGWANYLPATRGAPEPPSIRNRNGPAPGPEPTYPGAPPYGAQLYAPDGTPLYPGLPPAPPPGAPRDLGPTPGAEPFVPPVPAQVQPTPLPTRSEIPAPQQNPTAPPPGNTALPAEGPTG